MRRRELLLLVGAAMTTVRNLGAQQKAMTVVGYLNVYSPPVNLGDLFPAIHQGLSETGFVRGPKHGVGVPLGRRPI